MSTLQTATPCTKKLDPLKFMNYTFGMVLGVDEFKQEQTHLREKGRSHYRLAHGYGTICGLQVKVATSPDLEVQISNGVAVNPRGQEIHVQQLMCARLNDWLASHQTVLQELYGNPPYTLPLCVVLCYRECPTDVVPVPGEPCRTQQDAMSPSHIAESFQLNLCIDADQLLSPPSLTSPPNFSSLPDGLCFRPSQIEEDTIRGFGALLSRIQITDIAPSSVTMQQLEDLVRQLSPVTGASVVTSPPVGNSPIELYAGDAADFLRAAFLIWVTEVRPTLVVHNSSCGCAIPSEQCVLLAELSFTVGTVGTALQVVGTVTIDETRRPYLLETRLLQECLLHGRVGSGTGSGGAQAGSAVVTAGTFSLSLTGQATAVGPTFNGLTATSQGSGTYLLKWSGFPGYLKPTSSPPSSNTYVVKGTAMGDAAQGPFVLHLAGFLPQGIQIVVQKVAGLVAPTGFSVEISEITGV